MPFRALASAVTALGLAILSACTPLPSYRYKMTVEVDTPEGLKVGSGVIEVRAHHEPSILPQQGGDQTDVVGEAVAVDLSPDDTLFVLLAQGYGMESNSPEYIARMTLLTEAARSRDYSSVARTLARQPLKAVLRPAQYPMMARFVDRSRPATAQPVEVTKFQEAFGAGVRIRRITVETTTEAVTENIERRLPWLEASPRWIAAGVEPEIALRRYYKDQAGDD